MKDDPYLSTATDEGVVDFVAGSMIPSYPFERKDGALILKIYDQDGVLQDLPVSDIKDNEIFGVWLRRFDRYKWKH